MAYDDEPERGEVESDWRADQPVRALPPLFRADRDVNFAADAELLEQWSRLDLEELRTASQYLTLEGVRVAISMIRDVVHEYNRRIERTVALESRLRSITHETADHGQDTKEASIGR